MMQKCGILGDTTKVHAHT